MKQSSPSLSIITLTKNRAVFLKKNLASLVGQTNPGDEIILIDNASTDETGLVIASFESLLPIRSYRTTVAGYPRLYNLAVRKARGQIIVFLDDDCIANPAFMAAIRRAHQKHPNALIQGITHSIPHDNLYVDIMGDHYKNWLEAMKIGPSKLKTFDNKNASLPRKLFHKYHGFNPVMTRGSEDIELGLRLKRQGVPIYFDSSIIAFHHERTTFAGCIAQHRRFAASEGYLDRILDPSERLGAIPTKKLLLHIQSAWKRELSYIYRLQWKEALLLPLVYITLAWIRLWGYTTNR